MLGNDSRDLYLGTCPSLPDLVKIGISENPEERQLQIQRRWPGFFIRVVYKGAGQLETPFKRHFASRQAKVDKETEWFEMSLNEAVDGVLAISERQKEERKAEIRRDDEDLEREHKRRRMEAETQKLEANAALYRELVKLILESARDGQVGRARELMSLLM
ncbi:MAG: hypothetical protein EBZ48_18055 [Proteobacteria bacterium]|nr:hypothetical protein [Pseudomonadota bacterium]